MATVILFANRTQSGTVYFDGTSYGTYTTPIDLGFEDFGDPTQVEYRGLWQFDTSDATTGIPAGDVITKVELLYNYSSGPVSTPGDPISWGWYPYIGDFIGAGLDGDAGEFNGGSLLIDGIQSWPSGPPTSDVWMDLGEDAPAEINRSGNTDFRLEDQSTNDGSGTWYATMRNGAIGAAKAQLRLTYGPPIVTVSATLDGAGSFEAAAIVESVGASTLDGVATIEAAGSVTSIGAATLDGVGSIEASAVVEAVATATLDGVASIEASAVVESTASAQLDGVATIEAAAVVESLAAAVLDGVGTIEVDATVGSSSGATLDGIGSFEAAAIVDAAGYAVLDGIGTMTVNAIVESVATAILDGTATIDASAVVESTAAADLSGVGTVEASATVEITVTAVLDGIGSIEASAVVDAVGSAVLDGIGTLDVSATVDAPTVLPLAQHLGVRRVRWIHSAVRACGSADTGSRTVRAAHSGIRSCAWVHSTTRACPVQSTATRGARRIS